MNIHIDEVMDYVACPALYKLRHVDKLDPSTTDRGRANKNSILELYDKALHKAISFIFHSMQDGKYPGLHHLSKKWGFLWVGPRSSQEDIRFKQSSWRDTHDKKRTQGWKRLTEVWTHYREHGGHPVMVDFQYRLPLGRHFLTGTIDLVQVIKDEKGHEKIEMTEFLIDEKTAPFVHVRRDWRVTAASLAFRKTMNATEEKIVYHGVISGRLTTTERNEQDFRQLEHLLDTIDKAKREGIWYPVFNERCLTCPYAKHCERGEYDAEDRQQ